MAPISFKQAVTESFLEEQLPHGVALLFPNGFRTHFGSNLPPEQQQAVERYLKVFVFSTYKVIDPEGRVLDVKVDPRNLDSVEKLFQLLTGK